MKNLFLFIVGCIIVVQACKEPEKQLPDMHSGWMFKETSDSIWRSAEVPGCVHTDLLSHQLIDPPFYRDNEQRLQWIDKKDWEYKKNFEFHHNQLKGQQAWLTFEGLDTYADVFLNGNHILQSSNMFVGHEVRIDEFLRNGDNVLNVKLHSPIKKTMPYFENIPYSLPVSANDDDTTGQIPGKRISAFVRKAPFHFGWDFGPRFVTSGIWRAVNFETRHANHIRDIHIKSLMMDEDSALIDVNIACEIAQKEKAEIKINVNGSSSISKEVNLMPDSKPLRFPMKIKDPDFWWPRGYGKQNLYTCNVQLVVGDSVLSEKKQTFGLRTVELVQEPDSVGESFYFRVNGKPVYARGANMIPMNIFLTEVSRKELRTKLEDVVDANMNMIRIWGGGIYPDNYFYKLCDSLGIMVWQDFMFACSMVPDFPGYFDQISNEVTYNVKRLRNHPSLVLWCGNNEVISAWYNWGWKKRVTKEQGEDVAKQIFTIYDSLFHGLMPSILNNLDPNTPYWASSPQSAPGKPKNVEAGDLHYWMVWWGKAPFSSFRENTGRFVSEYGFQSIPSLSSLQLFMREAELEFGSKGFENHQKSTGGNMRLLHYLDHYYTKRTSFDNYPYLTQLLQGRAMEEAIQYHRVQKPYCMGSLLWQLNDCWPAVSWSIQDFYGKKKAAYYTVQESFEPVAVFADTLRDSLHLIFVSDAPEMQKADYELEMLDFYGNVLLEKEGTVHLSTTSNTWEAFEAMDSLKPIKDSVLIHIEYDGKNGNKEKVFLLNLDNNLHLPRPQFTYELKKNKNGAELTLFAPVFIRSMYVSFPSYEVTVEPNFIDMLPGQEYELTIKSKVNFKVLQSAIRFKNVNGFMRQMSK